MTSEEECVRALRRAADRLGESPTKAQYEELGLTPASGTILRVMGGWNAAKESADLETYQQGEFGGTEVMPKPEWVALPEDIVWEELNSQQRWYYKNREWRADVKERRRRKIRRWLFEFKRDNCRCRHCGETHPSCLDFHHVGKKRWGVSQMVDRGCSKSSILGEIDSCVVLCANCHRKEHYKPPPEDDSSQD